jgi:hypothetical protein
MNEQIVTHFLAVMQLSSLFTWDVVLLPVGNWCLIFGDGIRIFVFKGQRSSFSFIIFTFENGTTMLVNSSLHFRGA